MLTVQILGDHLRSGGSIVNVVPEHPREGSAEAAVKAAMSNWTAGQADALRHPGHHRQRGGLRTQRGAGLRRPVARTSPSVAAEITRLALFLTTPAARHITGQTLHVSHGALANFG